MLSFLELQYLINCTIGANYLLTHLHTFTKHIFSHAASFTRKINFPRSTYFLVFFSLVWALKEWFARAVFMNAGLNKLIQSHLKIWLLYAVIGALEANNSLSWYANKKNHLSDFVNWFNVYQKFHGKNHEFYRDSYIYLNYSKMYITHMSA